MGMSDKQFGVMLLVLVGIILWGGVVMKIFDVYGKVWALTAMNIVNVVFFVCLIFMYNKYVNPKGKGGKEE